jgi:hypothetical protein
MRMSMDVRTQVRIVNWAVAGATLLLAADVGLSAFALYNLSGLHTTLMSTRQLEQVNLDMTNNLLVAAVGAVVLGVLVVFMRRTTNKVRVAVWVITPLLALTMLCFLVGGPEWAVAPTGEEPEALRAEYAQAVPDWYVTLHGIAGLLAAVLLVFTAVFMTRADLREHYMDDLATGTGYRSWVERTER